MANSAIGSVTVKTDATKIQGVNVDATAPADGQVLAYNATDEEYQPVDQSGGGGGSVDEKTLRYRSYRYNN